MEEITHPSEWIFIVTNKTAEMTKIAFISFKVLIIRPKKSMFEVNRPGEIYFRHIRAQKNIVQFTFPSQALIFNIVFNHIKM